MHIDRLRLLGAAALCVALSACGDPEAAADKAVAKAAADWAKARDDLDPQKRVRAYDAAIKDLEAVGKKHAKTKAGEAMAAGRSFGGVSIATMKAERETLAARAECYARPTVECLRPFGSSMSRNAGGGAAPAENAQAEAAKLVCEKNFAAADKLLEPFKINRPAYAQQAVQVGLAAAQCGKPDEVKAAVAAWQTVEPSTGAQRANALMGILATPALQPGWPSVLGELEASVASGALDRNTTANATLNMAVRYAAMGDIKSAMAKYAYFTDELNFEANWQTKREFAATLIAAGEAETGLKMVENERVKSMTVVTLHEAAAIVGRRAGVIAESGAALPELRRIESDADYMKPIGGAEKASLAAAAANVETAVDGFAGEVGPRDSAVGIAGLDNAYGVLALVHQKLGEPAKASAAIEKGAALRQALLAPGAQRTAREYFSQFETVLAIAQGRLDDAAESAQHAQSSGQYTRLIVREHAAKGDVEKALTLAGQNRGDRSAYQLIIQTLIDAGKYDKAEEVINAVATDPNSKNGFLWMLVNKAAEEGDMKRAEAIAEKNGLITGPGEKLRILNLAMNNEKTAKNRRAAEPLIREIFAIGAEIEKAGASGRSGDQHYSQNAARLAFQHGYTDLGIELYKAAPIKDQRPLFAALTPETKPRDMTPILMLAQDNLSGERLGYVIDSAARALEAGGGK